MSDDKQLFDDLSIHFRDKLLRLVDDIIDTCKRVDMNKEEVALIILKHTLHVAIATAQSLGADLKEMLTVCEEEYQKLIKRAKNDR
jgi:hypothetical protein